ncbi:MAG: hypothetical protein KC413_18390, partial [Anaerolineales bacterium]|nr:hypothetical protein [Anaerolineales bacterium]
GTAERLPALTAGVFHDVSALIDAAWRAYSLAAAAPAEEQAAAVVAEAELAPPTAPPVASKPPRPQAQNLSLF